MKKYAIILCSIWGLTIFSLDEIQAQFIHFSQFNNQTQWLNPALTGSSIYHNNFTFTYRNQWVSVPASYETFLINFDMPISICDGDNTHFGIGAMAYRDQSGDGALSENSIGLSFAAHHLIQNGWQISLGGNFSRNRKKVNFDELIFPEAIDSFAIHPNLPSGQTIISNRFSFSTLQFGGSSEYIIDETTSIEIGGNYTHTFKSSHTFFTQGGEVNQFSGLWILHLGGTLGLGSHFSISPSALHMKKGDSSLNLIGSSIAYHFRANNKLESNKMYIGAWHRLEDAIVVLLGADFGKCTLSASYDVNTSDLDVASNGRGAGEISFIYRGLSKKCQ